MSIKGMRTIYMAVAGFLAILIAAVTAQPELVELIKEISPWAYPVIMVLLRLVTTGPVGK